MNELTCHGRTPHRMRDTEGRMKIALTHNLKPCESEINCQRHTDRYAEWDDEVTIKAVQHALAAEHEVIRVEGEHDIETRLRHLRPDMVFNMAEGRGGVEREAYIPAILERYGIPFTGSSARTLRLCLDKAATKRTLCRHGLPTLSSTIIHHPNAIPPGILVSPSTPLIVKPLHEGSSKGIHAESVVCDPDSLQKQIARAIETYRQPALVEPFLSGREFTVALLGNGAAVDVLPLVEIRFDALPAQSPALYSYEAKWIWDQPQQPLDLLQCPAQVEATLAATVRHLCRRAFEVLQCRDWCRIDVRLDGEGNPYILEVNPLPGILPDPDRHSCLPKAAIAAGISYPELVLRVLHHACQRYRLL